MVAALAALPLVGSIATATGLSAATVATIGLYGLTTAASLTLQMALAPDAAKQKVGTKLNTVLGGAVNLAIPFGTTETAGSFIFRGTWDNGYVPNAFLVKVYALSDVPIDGFEDTFWGSGRKGSYAGSDDMIDGQNVGRPVAAFNRAGPRLWVKILTGDQLAADPYLRAKFGGKANRDWTSGMIGKGRAYAIVTQKYDKKEPAGEVDPLFVIRGAKFYDFRKDSTNGGSGSHRYTDQTTWEFTQNPVVIAAHIMRGYYWDGEWLYGGQGWPARRIDINTFTAAANVCDEDIDIAGGGTQKRYRVGGEIDLSEEPWTVIERLLQSCNGRIAESGGIFKVYAGGIGASVFSFTDDDLIISEELTSKIVKTSADIANTIVGAYTEPDNAGEAKPYKPRFKAAYVDEDGGQVRKLTFDFPYVRDNRRAQRLATLALNDNRRIREFVIGVWTWGRKVEPCDVGSWTSTRFGFTNKKFIVGEPVLRSDGVCLIPLREADATDANWTVGDEDEFDVGEFEDVPVASQVKAVTATAIAIKDGAGNNKRPALNLAWSINDEDVDSKRMAYEVRLLDGVDLVANGTVDFDAGKIIISEGILKNEAYQVRARLIPESDRPTNWTAWADTAVYPGALDHVLAGNYGTDVDDNAPPALLAPRTALRTRRHRDGKIRQRLVINLNAIEPARPATEGYRIRVFDVDDNDTENFKTEEFPFAVEVQTGHTYTVRVLPVSRFGVVGPLSEPATFTGFVMPIPKKSTSDGDVPAVTSLTIATGHRRNNIEWAEVDTAAFPDWSFTLLERDDSTAFSGGGYKRWKIKSNKVSDVGLGNLDQKYYRATHYDTSGNPGATTTPVNSTTMMLVVSDVEAGVPADVEGIQTVNVNPDVIQGYDSIIKQEGDSVAWSTVSSNQRSPASNYRRVGTTSFQNKNPSPVSINMQMAITAFTSAGDAAGGQATRTVTVRFHSYPASTSPTNATVIWQKTLTHSATYGKKSKKPANALIQTTLVDKYVSNAKREYALEIFHQLKMKGPSHAVSSGGGVTGIRIHFIWNKK